MPIRLGSRRFVELLYRQGQTPKKGRFGTQVDPKTGTLELHARFPNPRHTALPGQFGRVRVQVEERKNALLVPQRAVQQLQNLQTVYVVGTGNKVAVRPVKTGARVGELWVVEEGLKPGDRVIVEGQLRVRPGAVVEPQAAKPKAGN